jgi:hypothetical protein
VIDSRADKLHVHHLALINEHLDKNSYIKISIEEKGLVFEALLKEDP